MYGIKEPTTTHIASCPDRSNANETVLAEVWERTRALRKPEFPDSELNDGHPANVEGRSPFSGFPSLASWKFSTPSLYDYTVGEMGWTRHDKR